MKQHSFSKRGFIIVETLVAISIILTVIPAVLTMATKGISLGVYAKQQMVASYLAEEGIEYVRARRDYNILRIERADPVLDAGVTWDEGFDDNGLDKCKKGCTINPMETIDNIIQKCNGSCKIDTSPPDATYRLYLNQVTGMYSHDSSGTPTPYYRSVFVSKTSDPLQSTITSIVVWSMGASQRSVIVTGFLTRWFQ